METTPRHVNVRQEGSLWPHLMEPLRHLGSSIAHIFSPSADASRGKDSYEITLELPGVSADDVDVSLNDHVLTVKGEKRSERKEETDTYFFAERRYGAFQRAFQLPSDVDTDKIDADFSNGVLKLILPKLTSAQERDRQIKVRTS